jgi:hypothetical protein
VLVYFARQRRDVPFRLMFWLFGAFIVACGFTHFMEVVAYYTPVYRLSAIVKLITAVVSWATVLALIPVTPQALAMRFPQELQREIADRKSAQEPLIRKHKQLWTPSRSKARFSPTPRISCVLP